MKFTINSRKGAYASVAALALTGAALGAAMNMGGANAATQVRYTKSGTVTVAGDYAHSTDNQFNFTHIESYLGSDGGSSLENLPVTTALQDTATYSDGTDITGLLTGDRQVITGGVGIGLCDSASDQAAGGDAVQLGAVYIGNGLKDIVAVAGQFGPVLNTQNLSKDRCQNGLLSTDPGATVVDGEVLLAGIPVADTVQAGILTDPFHTFFWRNQAFTAGHVVFYATDLSTNENSNGSIAGFVNGDLIANEADAGAVSDTSTSLALTNVTVPLPNFGAYHHTGVSELARWAHVIVNGNDNVTHKETRGAFQSTGTWNVFNVASTSDGLPGGILKLAPSTFGADNFYVGGGIGLVS